MSDSDLLAQERDEAIQTGDVVRTGTNTFPQWRVLAVHGDKAWVRNLQTHVDGVTDLFRCRKVEAA
jgi:hypothetical protein